MTATQLPDPLAALAARLEEAGLAVDEQPPDRENFGNQMIMFEDERLRVRIVLDRSDWTIELAHPSWESLYDPDIWHAALEGTDPTEPSTLEEQAAYVTGALDTLREAAGDPALRERLDEIAIARADLWFG